MGRWGKADDAKVRTLWETPSNGIDPEDLTVETVQAVHKEHWPNFKSYTSFARRYRAKAREYAVGKTLEGHRKSECQLCFVVLPGVVAALTFSRLV